MKIVQPSVRRIDPTLTPYKLIEQVGRICYKSEDKIADEQTLILSKNW